MRISFVPLLAGAALLLQALATDRASAQVWEVGNQLYKLWPEQGGEQYGSALAIGDFDDDGIDDMAIGARLWNSSNANNAGSIHVYFGATSRELTTSGLLGMGYGDDEQAGFALAAGDFNHDGVDELAVGSPYRNVVSGTTKTDAGAVTILRYVTGEEVWAFLDALTQKDTLGTTPEDHDHFGQRLAVGRFNADLYDDLAVASYGEDWGANADCGIVHVFYGSAGGLRTDNETLITPEVQQPNQWFGYSMAAGDFNGDGRDDLAIGAPDRTVSAHAYAGGVEIFFGATSGISPTDPQVLSKAAIGSISDVEEYFGWSLAAANFDESPFVCAVLDIDCYDDLAIGVPGQTVNGHPKAGMVLVGEGTASGIAGFHAIYPSSVAATTEDDDLFGWTLAAGSLDKGGSAYADLAIATPQEEYVAGCTNDGVVHIVFGSSSGLNSGAPAQLVAQRAGFKIAPADDEDLFGWVLAIGDFDDDGWGDLAVGVPYRDIGALENAGQVQLLFGALFADGFESHGTTWWSP